MNKCIICSARDTLLLKGISSFVSLIEALFYISDFKCFFMFFLIIEVKHSHHK